MTKHRD